MVKKILIAGGTGLVGANLTKRFQTLDYSVTSTKFNNSKKEYSRFPKYDFQNFDDCIEATKDRDIVIIAAGFFHGVQEKTSSATHTLLPNLKINASLFEAAALNGVKQIVLISTSTVYQQTDFPVKESDLDLNTPPYESYFGIGWTYRYIEKLAEYYARMYNIRVVILRPTNIYGPNDSFEDHKSHVIPALIKRAIKQENPFFVWGDSNVIRDFIYVDDVVDDIIYAIESNTVPSCEPINLCNGTPVSIKELLVKILNACKFKPEINFDRSKQKAIPYRALDDTKYKSYFLNRKRISLEEGIQRTINWYSENN